MSQPTNSYSPEELATLEREAATYRRLVDHLRERTDVQNIDLMNLSGFCRNCLSKWYKAAAESQGVDMSYDQARELVYGEPYDDWKTNYQKEATAEQQAAFKISHAATHGDTKN